VRDQPIDRRIKATLPRAFSGVTIPKAQKLTDELLNNRCEFGIRTGAEIEGSFDIAERDAAVRADEQIIDRLFRLTAQPLEGGVSSQLPRRWCACTRENADGYPRGNGMLEAKASSAGSPS
jgi:hypothetical protein